MVAVSASIVSDVAKDQNMKSFSKSAGVKLIKPALRKGKKQRRPTSGRRPVKRAAEKAATVMEKLVGLGMEIADARRVAETVKARGQLRQSATGEVFVPLVNDSDASSWLPRIIAAEVPRLV